MSRWTHTTADWLLAMSGAHEYATGRAWGTSPAHVAALRALAAGSYLVAAHFATNPPQGSASQLGQIWPVNVDALRFASPERASVAGALLRTWALLTRNEPTSQDVTTAEAITIGSGESSLAPAAVVAIVIVASGAAGTVACYLGDKALTVLDRDLTRRAEVDDRDKRRVALCNALLAAHAAALNAVDEHVEGEKTSGAPRPLSADARRALAALEKTQRELAGALKSEPGVPRFGPLPSIFPNFGDRPGTFLAAGGASLVLLAAAGLVAWWLTKE